MDNLVKRFKASGDAGWEVTYEMPGSDTGMLIIDNPDILLVQWGSRYFLLNRNYIGKPKILENGNVRNS